MTEQARLEEVTREVAQRLYWYSHQGGDWSMLLPSEAEHYMWRASKILSLKDKDGKPMLGIIDPDQSLPLPYIPGVLKPDGRPLHGAIEKTGEEAQKDMWDNNFRKIIVEE